MKKLSSPIDLIKKSIDIYSKKKNFVLLAELYIPLVFFSILSIAENYLPGSIRSSGSIWLTGGMWFIQAVYLLVTVFVTAAVIIAFGQVIKGDKFSVKETFASAWKKYWIFLLLNIVLALAYLLGFVLLIVPGVLFVVWFAFSRFIMIEKGTGIKESFLESKELVKGNYWRIFGRLVVFGVFAVVCEVILSIIPYGVGSVINVVLGGLFILPSYLLFKELSA
ncbi:MAG: hypothetical protein ABSC49_00340 [Candidatus Microgenomates bacterium]|jgi:hypothetical protein